MAMTIRISIGRCDKLALQKFFRKENVMLINRYFTSRRSAFNACRLHKIRNPNPSLYGKDWFKVILPRVGDADKAVPDAARLGRLSQRLLSLRRLARRKPGSTGNSGQMARA